MGGHGEVVQVVGGETAVQGRSEAHGGLGRVLGHVAGDLLSRQLTRVVAVGDVANVELRTPAHMSITRAILERRAGHGNASAGLTDRLLEERSGERLRWGSEAGGAAAVGGGVQTQDGVEVDRATALELGHLGIGHPHQPGQFGLGQAGAAGQVPVDGDGGSAPQLWGQSIPDHLRVAVIAAGAQRLTEPGIGLVVAVLAAGRLTMRAALTLPVGIAGVDQPTLSLAGVDLAEAGGGEGDEQPRMAGHGLGDALAAFQPSSKELIAVGLVGRRAGRAHRGPTVAAGLQEGGVGFPVSRIQSAALLGRRIDLIDRPAQPNRVGAVASGRDLLDPAVIAGTGAGDGLGHHSQQQLSDLDRLAHATSPEADTWGTTRKPGGATSATSSAGSRRSAALARMMAATWW